MTDLYQRYLALQAQHHTYQRDAAVALGVSEGEIVACLPESTYLGKPSEDFLLQLAQFGEVQSIVRNDLAVSEKRGVYHNLDLSPVMGTAINMGGLDLRLFLRHWRHLFAVSGKKYSFQIFDAYGNAIQKIYLTNEQQIPYWTQICQQLTSSETPSFDRQPEKTSQEYQGLSDEEKISYQEEWRQLKNVHHFRMVLSQFGIDRLQGLEYAPSGDALRLQTKAIEVLMQRCAERGITLLIFVNNGGVVQIQTGRVHHVSRLRGWLNIMDDQEEQFTLHLHDENIAQFWFVRRPGSNGIVHSFEAYDAQRQLVLQLFGRQADATTEPENWQELVQEILAEFQAA